MKKIIFPVAALLATVAFTSCSDDNDEPRPTHEIRVLTFEDGDYKAGPNYVGQSSWSSLIDDVQYGGELLYPEDYEDENLLYRWSDANNTFLAHEFPNSYGDLAYWGGGHVISNYVNAGDLSSVSYTDQLEVYVKGATAGHGGHNGSANFAVHNGYRDKKNAYVKLPTLYFSDGEARVIDHMYVAATAYLANYVLESGVFDAEKYFKVVATGYDTDGNAMPATASFTIAADGKIIDEWTKWDLSVLGAVAKVEFNIDSNDVGDHGLNAPGYFAYDDVAVVFPLD